MCEHDTSITITLTDSNFKCFSYVIKKTSSIDIRLIYLYVVGFKSV